MELRCTPLAVESSSVVQTLDALPCSRVTVTTNTKVYVVATLTFATLAVLFLGRNLALSKTSYCKGLRFLHVI